MGERLARGEPVVPMYGPLELAWLRRQAEIAEELVAGRAKTTKRRHHAET